MLQWQTIIQRKENLRYATIITFSSSGKHLGNAQNSYNYVNEAPHKTARKLDGPNPE